MKAYDSTTVPVARIFYNNPGIDLSYCVNALAVFATLALIDTRLDERDGVFGRNHLIGKTTPKTLDEDVGDAESLDKRITEQDYMILGFRFRHNEVRTR